MRLRGRQSECETSPSSTGPLLVGLATLRVVSTPGGTGCSSASFDDARWLDGASAQLLGFVAGRVHAEAVLVLFATREVGDADDLTGTSELRIDGLSDPDARELQEPARPRPRAGAVESTIG